MSTYTAPLRDMQFLMKEIASIYAISALPGYEEATSDVAEAILDEAGKIAAGVLAPLNWSGDREGARFADRQVTMPAGFGLFVLRRPIVGAAFEHGNVSAADALATSRALGGFALGLVGFSVYLFVLRVFYAHHDARTPFVINLVENAINIALALVLVDRFGLLGLGVSFAAAYLLSALWAMQVLSYKVPGFPLRPLLGALYRFVLASAVMAEGVWGVARTVGANSGAGAVLRLAAGTVTGVAVYIGVLAVLRAPELDELRHRFSRTQGTGEAQ